MKHFQKKSPGIILKNALAKFFVFASLLFSFNANAGGDSYEIYLNSKLILKQYVTQPLNIKSLQLDKANSSDQLVIVYSHCGQTGKGRSIAIKDDNGNLIKEWKFADANGSNVSMIIPVAEILKLRQNNGNHLAIYYSAKQLPKGRFLTSLNLANYHATYPPKPLTGFIVVIILTSVFWSGKLLG